jgi:hypothetical protein
MSAWDVVGYLAAAPVTAVFGVAGPLIWISSWRFRKRSTTMAFPNSTLIFGRAAFAAAVIGLAAPGMANVITDWDARAVAMAAPGSMGQREMAILHVAMFDAVNSIERRYRPYLAQFPASSNTSQEAAAATAAAAVLTALHPDKAAEIKAALSGELAGIPDSSAKADGVKLGEQVAAKILEARANDGANAPDAYRPRATPGVYVPTATLVGSAWPNMTPFAMTSASQFRPPPPVALSSKEWADDFNEIKSLGARNSSTRSPQQTETARFWLMVGAPAYHPLARQLVDRKKMSVVDSARLMALYAVAMTDAYIAVFDAKYHYEFWRPITAIRNGDLDGNPATERDPTWQPIDNTPMHPEYPCAHCIQSGAAVAVLEALLGSDEIPEISMTSSTAPGVTHRWSSLRAFTDEVASARIWAGFHYRFSTRVGTAMGRSVGQYVVQNVMQPASVANAQ